jgi:hypothetical protein
MNEFVKYHTSMIRGEQFGIVVIMGVFSDQEVEADMYVTEVIYKVGER